MEIKKMEIKKKEVIFSVVIIAVMLIVGFIVSDKIQQAMLEKYQVYDTAVQIDSEELFRHGMKVNTGHAFVYGDLKTIDPVSFPELKGKYSYIKKHEQKYQMHSRIVTKVHTRSDGSTYTTTETEYYWTWDTIRTESKTSKKISFLNVEFKYKKIPFPSSKQVEIINTGYHTRNVYYGTDTNFQGTIFTNLKDDTINETSFYKNQTISETIEKLESGSQKIIFWILWSLLTAGCVLGFYYRRNKWLD